MATDEQGGTRAVVPGGNNTMRWCGDIHIDHVTPPEDSILRALGVPPGHAVNNRTRDAVAAGLEELRTIAEASGVFASIGKKEFADIYEGEGDNAVPSPLAEIFPRADELALFAVTLGTPVSERIAELFTSSEYALGGALDAAASEAAELTADHIARTVLGKARHAGRATAATRALGYSPGYCGWNLTGQRALFAALEPGSIGIALTDSCLMDPVKSVSGVVVLGPADTHDFDDHYDFCSQCSTHDCRDRIRRIREPGA
jgi:hypothetical protein